MVKVSIADLRARAQAWPPRAVDAALVAVLLVETSLEAVFVEVAFGDRAAFLALSVLVAAGILVRRRWPLPAVALALLAAGLAASSVGTYSGQVVMDGFLRRRIPLAARRLVTMAPALLILASGVDPTRALVLSQVVLSFGIPFALVPLVWSQVVLSFGIPFALGPLLWRTSRRERMGGWVNRRRTTLAGALGAGLIIALNAHLLLGLVAA